MGLQGNCTTPEGAIDLEYTMNDAPRAVQCAALSHAERLKVWSKSYWEPIVFQERGEKPVNLGSTTGRGMNLRHILKLFESFNVRRGRDVNRNRGVGGKSRFGGDGNFLFR